LQKILITVVPNTSQKSLVISSQVSNNQQVVLEANQTQGYVLMNPGFLTSPNSENSFSALVSPILCKTSIKPIISKEGSLTQLDRKVMIYPNPAKKHT